MIRQLRVCITLPKDQNKISLPEPSWAVVVQTFNLSTWEAEAGGSLSSEFKASLVYKENSRTVRAVK